MTISLVGSFGGTGTTTGTSTTLPAGISGGDAVFAVGVCVNTLTMSPPAGWTVVSGWPKDGSACRFYLWTKTTVTSADSSTSQQFTTSGTTKQCVAGLVLHSSVSFPAAYFDGTPAFQAQSGTDTTYTAPQSTSTVAGCWGVAAFGVRGTDPTAWTPATGLTERQDLTTTGGGAFALHLCDSAGSIGAASTTFGPFDETNISSSNGGGLTLLVKENTAGGTSNPYPKIGHWRSRTGVAWRTSMDTAESIWGTFQGHWTNYHPPGSLPLTASERQAIADGKRLHLYWKPYPASGGSWAYTAAGSYNTTIDQVAQSIKNASPNEIWLTLAHEPENDTTGATGNFSYQAYKDMWAKVRERFDLAGVSNVRWVWAFMSSLAHPTEALNLWPGDALVDVTAFQQYINSGTTATLLASRWLDTIQWLRDNSAVGRRWADTDGKDLAVTEWGADLDQRGTDQHRADAIDGVTAILQSLADRRVLELDFFDARGGFLNSPPTVDGQAYANLKAASEAGQSSSGGGGGGSPGPIQVVGYATSGDGATQSTQTVSFTLPAGWQQGDYAVAFIGTNSRPDMTAVPLGWELIDGPTDNGTIQRGWVYARRLVTGDVDPVWTLSQSVRPTGVLGVWRGVHPDTPIHASSPLTATSSSTSQSAGAVTTSVDTWLVTAWLTRWSAASGTNYGTAPGGTHTPDASASVSLG